MSTSSASEPGQWSGSGSGSGSGSDKIQMDFNQLKTLSRDEIKSRIAAGQVLVLHRSLVYKLNSWLNSHPGGQLAILHFVGRDATDEIEAYHPEHVLSRMLPFVVGRVCEADWDSPQGWRPLRPPVQAGLWPLPEPVSALESPRTCDSGYASLETSSCEGDAEPSQAQAQAQASPPIGPRTSTFAERLRALEPDHAQSPLWAERQQQIARSFRALHRRVREAGMYKAPGPLYGYGADLARFAVLFACFLATSPIFGSSEPGTLRCFVSAVFLGMWWHQITFVAHDAGHTGITGNWTVDRLIGIAIGNFCGGMSIGWWCDNHDIHHLVTNDPEHDPDIQHLPFFAISTRFFDNLRSSYYNHVLKFDGLAKVLVKKQHWIYYPVMIFARFNLFGLSYGFLSRRKTHKMRGLEIIGILWFWMYFSTLLYLLPSNRIRLMYILVSFAVTSPLHVQIVLSHFGQSTVDLGLQETFAHRQLRTTTDVKCARYLDFLHGGLNLQVVHHLFPRLPRHRLRQVKEQFVVGWCEEVFEVEEDLGGDGIGVGVGYHEIGFVGANVGVIGTLKEVADQVKVMGIVARAKAKGEIH